MLNTIVSGVSGALMKSFGHMGWLSGNTLGGIGMSFLDILDLRWVVASSLVFVTMCSVGNNPLR
jgi:hypothetical protein